MVIYVNPNKLLKKLDLTIPIEDQVNVINEFKKIKNKHLNKLIRPFKNKSYWKNAAIAIREIGYPKIEEIIPDLIVWLQDMTWPGAMIIEDVLMTVPREVLTKHIENAVEIAWDSEDDEWIYWISELVKDYDISKEYFKNQKNYSKLLEINKNY